LFCVQPLFAQQVVRLYPRAAPGSERWTVAETVRETPGGGAIISNVRDPSITAYLPDPARANGSAVIFLPGGGLRVLALGAESEAIIRRLTSEGMAVFVLKYRILQTNGTPPAPPPTRLVIRNGNANPAPDDAALGEVLRLASDDARTALHMIRASATKWRIDPARVGMLGASAGGGVAIAADLHPGGEPAPAFLATLYGPSLMDVGVGPDAPPLFMATETDHGPVTDGLLALFSLWKGAGRPAELHVIQTPRLDTSQWLDRFVVWLGEQHMMGKPAAH
jgi:dienelactone hydrolase